MARKLSGGRGIQVTVPAGQTVNENDFCVFDNFFGWAVQGVPVALAVPKIISINIESWEYDTSQFVAADAMAKGSLVYWDTATKKLTNTVATNKLVGRVTAAKANGVISVLIFAPGA